MRTAIFTLLSRHRKLLASAWAGAALALAACGVGAQQIAAPPAQPTKGPGGSDYRHRDVAASVHGTGALQFWLFEPAGPKPKDAPAIVFIHGWGALEPAPYRGWIDHIVRRGNVIIFPRYQADNRTPQREFTANAIAAVRAALELLRTDSARVRADPARFALVGHSVGGSISVNVAALASRSGLPAPAAVMSVFPGKSWGLPRRAAFALEDLSAVPAQTLMLTIAGDRDRVVRDIDARRIHYGATQIPPQNKNFVLMTSDSYGTPALEAHHFAPLARSGSGAAAGSHAPESLSQRERQVERRAARGESGPDNPSEGADPDDRLPDLSGMAGTAPDALDFFGFWKLFDALTDAAFYRRNREYALGNTEQQRWMGLWSDQRPVRELIVLDRP